jgi:hypothetical protein
VTPLAGSAADFGSAVALTLSLGPAPLDRDDDSDGFSENQGDCNDADGSIYPGANDPSGDGIDQDCDGIDGNLTLAEIIVEPGDATVLVGQQSPLSATGVFEDGTAQNLTGHGPDGYRRPGLRCQSAALGAGLPLRGRG